MKLNKQDRERLLSIAGRCADAGIDPLSLLETALTAPTWGVWPERAIRGAARANVELILAFYPRGGPRRPLDSAGTGLPERVLRVVETALRTGKDREVDKGYFRRSGTVMVACDEIPSKCGCRVRW